MRGCACPPSAASVTPEGTETGTDTETETGTDTETETGTDTEAETGTPQYRIAASLSRALPPPLRGDLRSE